MVKDYVKQSAMGIRLIRSKGLARTIGSSVGREIVRGFRGSLLDGARRK
ncbi:MAG: hypothetical protein Q8O28_13410 [Smithellaceae bacterium]|nr:hypothetical protein [Smithellaceae bacterium]